MKKIIYAVFAMLIFASCEKPNKIGFVDNGTIINDYQEKKDLEAKFQIKEEAYRNKFDSIDQAFQMEVQKFQSEAQRMSQNKAQQKYQELGQKKQIQDQQKQVEAQAFQQAFQSELDSIINKVKKFENEYGKTNGYTYILGTSDAQATVLFGAEENDLTQTILDALNAEYEKK
ncbi:hypothetical protein GCM10023315_16450 [Algibacter aquimarinus]|uniref:Periplasmic chaperone for outer membrane proteins Skp n=2 Tax=Algibacter aquimarinus TaxID=1136748 RepID=A0ABP9HCM4_9FLAO